MIKDFLVSSPFPEFKPFGFLGYDGAIGWWFIILVVVFILLLSGLTTYAHKYNKLKKSAKSGNLRVIKNKKGKKKITTNKKLAKTTHTGKVQDSNED